MSSPSVLQRHPSLRWLAPLAVVGVAGLAATGMFRAQASSESLPETSPAALIAAVQAPDVDSGFSGTVVSRLSLGLPELPSFGNAGNGSSMTSLLSGSHTLQVWYGGPAQQRVAVLGATDETDVFRSGRQVWQWTSADRVAVHAVLPAHSADDEQIPSPSPAQTVTPSQMARSILDRLDPSTTVTVKDDQTIANRSAYELILQPRTLTTRIGAVHIAVDGKTKTPLGVQVYARGKSTPSIDIAYTSIRFDRPPSTYFSFTPPSGATVRTVDVGDPGDGATRAASRLKTVGTGWSTIWTYPGGKAAARQVARGPLADVFTRVSGSWGSGRLATSDLLSVLVTDSGRVLAGPVEPYSLYAAAK